MSLEISASFLEFLGLLLFLRELLFFSSSSSLVVLSFLLSCVEVLYYS